jgi:integrase
MHTGTRLRVVRCTTMSRRGYTLPTAWETAVGGWLEWLRLQGLRETTLRTRRGQVRAIARQSRTRRPSEVDLAMLVRLCGRPGISVDHRHGQRAALVSFYQWCVGNDVASNNPATLLPKVRSSQPRPRPAPDKVWAELLGSAHPRECLMSLLACEAGLRRAEVAGLHLDDLVRDHDGYLLIIRGKGGKQRVVPITVGLAARIRTYCCNGGYLFPGQDDGHLSPDCVGRLISRLMPPGWTMHKLRHRYATRGYNGTHDLLALSMALGHSSVATTQRYTAVTLMDIRAVSEAAADDVLPTDGGLSEHPHAKTLKKFQDWTTKH